MAQIPTFTRMADEFLPSCRRAGAGPEDILHRLFLLTAAPELGITGVQLPSGKYVFSFRTATR